MDNDQRNLSEQLQLLHELQYSDLVIPFKGATHSSRQSRDSGTNRDVRLLDTIAVALTTGNPGDVVAAAFDKREKMQLVLAKNGPPTPNDVAAANELISLIGSPAISDAVDLFPFLIHRCGANINKRIRNLHTFIQDGELRNDFTLALKAYEPVADITAEFPGASSLLLEIYGDAPPPIAALWGDFVEKLTDKTAQGLNAEDVSSSIAKYVQIFVFADALGRFRFLKILVEDRNLLTNDRKGRAKKLKRRLDKVCQYISGISHLVQKAKRFFPISHHWVVDTFTGTGESVFNLCDNAYDAVSCGLDCLSLSPEIVNKLDKNFPSISSNWERQQTIHTCIHAELRVILHLGLPSAIERGVHPIGVSKRSCFCCTLWIESHNRLFGTQWMTSGSRGQTYANWALPGAACSYAIQADGRSSVDEDVLKAVSTRLTDTLDWLFPGQKRISDEHVSSGDENSDSEPASEWAEWRLRPLAVPWLALAS